MASDQISIRAVFGALFLALWLAALDQTVVSTALPTMVADLGGLSYLSWVVTAYLLTSTVAGPLYGKFGDLYGRKIVLQVAIAVFLVGSALCGIAQNMVQLIIFRALEGVGGGGLIVITIAVIGDLIPPRERGRYQGFFGAVFGTATIVGPLVGGFLVDHLSWRWIFYINLPTGILAMAVIAAVLPSRSTRRRHAIDYSGALLLTAALSAVILFTGLGGTTFPWTSPVMLGLLAASVAGTLAFVIVELRSSEPILPMSLFGNRNFAVASGVGFIVGLSLFGAVTFLPIYLQVVKGVSPLASGVLLMPMMLGMLATSVISGRIISRFGRYKLFPILGTGTMTFGLGALSLLTIESNDWQTAIDALWLGLGMGMVMQVLIIAVQNSVDYKHLGVATSGTMLFRSLGGALGVALFGAIFANRLHAQLAAPGMDFLATVLPSAVKGLPPNLHEEYITAVMAALRPVFLVAAAISALGFALAWMLREYPLREGAPAEGMGESFAMPRDATSLEELERIITLLVARENRWRLYADVARRAAVDLPAPELWMLARLGERAPITLASLSAELNIPQGQLAPPLDALCTRGIAEKTADGELQLTSVGAAMRDRIVAARRKNLADMLTRWRPEEHPDVLALIERMAQALTSDLPAPRAA
ncbi:MAG TPA: MFS transporter [Xanthobacteraceae bacterium]|nr:MFS transporter [Xanthobacteraceae bacterium]